MVAEEKWRVFANQPVEVVSFPVSESQIVALMADGLAAARHVEILTDRIKELEIALHFYAVESNWRSPMGLPPARDDRGAIARAALGLPNLEE